MTNRIRLLACSITFAGAALLATATPAHSTMSRDRLDPLGTRFCCGSDTDGDGRPGRTAAIRAAAVPVPEGSAKNLSCYGFVGWW